MKVHIITFGCKVNQCESEAILELMISSGFEESEEPYSADVVIFNSCAVTSESSKKLRKSLKRIKSGNSSCITVLMGCVAQACPEELSDFQGFDIVIGNSNKHELLSYILEFMKSKNSLIDIRPHNTFFANLPIKRFSGHTRAFLKIEDGCNRFCSYCIIPYARGQVRSKPIEDIKTESENLANNGYKEINLVGINLSSYGLDLGLGLYDAIEAVSALGGIDRIRLGSLEPDLISEEFLEKTSQNGKFCPHFHLSLQSGSDKILKSMRRLYTAQEYLNIVDRINNIFSHASITTDLIVGFPGEDEEDFCDSLDVIKRAGFLKVHVFPYSRRPGTLAFNMPNQVPKEIKSLRVKAAQEEAGKQTSSFLNKCIGKEFEVLYESSKEDGFYDGYTSNYVPVRTKSEYDIIGKIINTRIIGNKQGHCVGVLV